MAIDKAIDSTQLDADLTSVANAIRTKGGTSASLAFPAGFADAIDDIQDFLVKRCNGTLTSYESLAVTKLTQGCFRSVETLTSLKVYNCTSIDGYCLMSTHLEHIAFPGMVTVGVQAFCYIGANYLKSLDLGANLQEIKIYGFAENASFATLILRKTSIPVLSNTNAFNNTQFKSDGTGGTIYIPKVLYDHLGDGTSLDYKAATNWSTILGYANNQIKSIESTHTDPNAPIDLTLYYADGTLIPT